MGIGGALSACDSSNAVDQTQVSASRQPIDSTLEQPILEVAAVETDDSPPVADGAAIVELNDATKHLPHDSPSEVASQPVSGSSSEAVSDDAPFTELVTLGELGAGDTLMSSLAKRGVPSSAVNRIAIEMRGYFDFRRSHPGDTYRLVLDETGLVESFRYRITDLVHYDMVRDFHGRYTVKRTEAVLSPRQSMIAGIVESSLYGSISQLGGSAQLADDFVDVFSYDVDFSRMVHLGDEYRILYERLYLTDDSGGEVFVKPGRILAARYSGESGEHTAVYFETAEGEGGYYRPDGSSVERQFLMAPLRYARISSRYSSARRHPILKITRPHHGIDYAAALGTPVYAVAGGEVSHKSWAGGFGNLVKIKHPNGYTSYYAHLSRFSTGLRLGQSVSQKQVIGYVGKTGLATGPHVCFRVAKDGKYVNPARISSPPGPPLPPEAEYTFRLHSDMLLAALDSGTLVASDEAL